LTVFRNQIEITREMSRMFRNGQTIANQEDDGRLWSRTPMQKFRSKVDAQVYLDDLINVLCEFLVY
jgi:hypothetical protein